MKLPTYAKALAGAVAAGAGTLATALSDGTVTGTEGVTIGLAVLGALGIVWRVPNGETKDSS
ncbi:hypothetical protein ABZT17_34870 [Streptomyces sp. NPDC005648]|uniref:hypothetical protein n=1 Tax=Streptomyces sp. NPDC005648 TaxID=3157044 RepID=UPI0033B8CD39